MIKVTLNKSDGQHIEAIRMVCDSLCDRDPDFNGATIQVSSGDFTAVDDPSNEIRGAQLLAAVNSKLDELNSMQPVTTEIHNQRAEYILNDERFGNEPYLVHADNDEQLCQDMPCVVDWANEHYNSLESDDTTTREQCLAGKIADTWAVLNVALSVPNHPELAACYEGGKYQIYRRHEGCDTLTYVESRDNLAEFDAAE